MPKAINVTVAKPRVGGAVWNAPAGTTLPAGASAVLDEAFVSLGYISSDGIVNANSPETEDVVAWGGDTVYTVPKSKKDTFKFTLIEALNPDVLKSVYGPDNVSGTLATGITVKANNNLQEPCAWVIDTILRGGVLKRLVLPCAAVSAVGDITYADSSVMGYETTLAAMPDDEGNTHYEYMVKGDVQA